MKSTLSLLALTAVFGAFAAGPMAAVGTDFDLSRVAPNSSAGAGAMMLADNDSDNDQGAGQNEGDDDGCSGDDDEGDDAQPCTDAQNPAPQGTKTPPKNGLFGDGAAPKVQVN